MPKREDIEKILIIGSGPIVIGQACEFDYSGAQACKALKEEGYQVVLANSNPATIMTDPEMADRTYIEPLTPEIMELIIERERPQALLPTLGGQTGLNLAWMLAERGVLDKYGVELIGAKLHAIKKAEDRSLFKEAMANIGLDVPMSSFATSWEEAMKQAEELGFPLVIRPSFCLGGSGANIAYNREEFETMVKWGLSQSPMGEVLLEESVIGWKEYELEVMRDCADNVVVICSIENFDPMGIHTGDSITVAPAQTLTDKEYQKMRDWAKMVIKEIGVDTGGSNIQFAVEPRGGRMVVIEMNPRVSRSSALASKATGFPIAKIAAKLAVGYRLDEIPNDITKKTPASFEPTIDYCVVKIPRWAFEKFPQADPTLGIQMKSVGEVMAIGRTFKEAFQKGLRALEIDCCGFVSSLDNEPSSTSPVSLEERLKMVAQHLRVATHERAFYIKEALQADLGIEEIHNLTKIDPWFLHNLRDIYEMEKRIKDSYPLAMPFLYGQEGENQEGPFLHLLKEAKQFGFSDCHIAQLWKTDELTIRRLRIELGLEATYKMVDTCAGEFEAVTPYYYSTYSDEDEVKPSSKKKIMILGSGPNRIGQGIEFDYCCVHASLALKGEGYETIMVNSNPETVSTDYDISDRLYFEPLTLEDVLNIVHREKPEGVIVQLGGQTPLKLAVPLKRAGVKILGTPPESIDTAEDRKRFKEILERLALCQPENDTATSFEEALVAAKKINFPVVVRPSYVLGGRAMEVVYEEGSLKDYMARAVKASPSHPVLIEKFLEEAIEVDVDALCDGKQVLIGGIMEHIEHAGIHSGDSAMVLPPYTLTDEQIHSLKTQTTALAMALGVVGLINIQFAIKNDTIYVLEVNPRASRTIPFVSKAIGIPLAKMAAKVMVGMSLEQLGLNRPIEVEHFSVKESVFPFVKFPGVDIILGPEMKSTGEVMGMDADFGIAFAKSQMAADSTMPLQGKVFISVTNRDKRNIIFVAKKLQDMGFSLIATFGTAKALQRNGITVEPIFKVNEGRPNILDKIKNKEIDLIINTPLGRVSKYDEFIIRREAVEQKIPCITTLAGAAAAVNGIEALKKGSLKVKSLHEYHKELALASRGRKPF